MVATPLLYDPYDYVIDANPHPIWKRLRDEAPVYYNEQHDFYALSRFDDVLAAHLDPATFSSAHTTVLEGRTVIAIAHRLFSAHDADRVAVVEDGLLEEIGTHDELVARGGSYAALWDSWHSES